VGGVNRCVLTAKRLPGGDPLKQKVDGYGLIRYFNQAGLKGRIVIRRGANPGGTAGINLSSL